mmetsp:Transcript_25837/g.38200  ORF Transcript_25837/g.38200 Transcript_25837/m.38200 type:complete len:225 (+) Transcript_25837:125-799(+)
MTLLKATLLTNFYVLAAVFISTTSVLHVAAFCPNMKSLSNPASALRMSNNEPPLTVFLDRVSNTGINNKSIKQNSLVITKYDIPDLGIFADQTYELQSIYLQGERKSERNSESGNIEQGVIEKIELAELNLEGQNAATANGSGSGFTLYIKLYNPVYHDNDQFKNKAVIVTPEEVGLVSMKDEVLDSVVVAIPILSFWLGLCYMFASTYNQKYGGNFLDAFFGK